MAEIHCNTTPPSGPVPGASQQETEAPEGYNLALGRQLIQAPSTDPTRAIVHVDGYCHDTGVSPGDLCCVDFTDTALGDGLFIITVDDQWIGFKRFQRTADGRLQVIERGAATDVASQSTESFKVIGRVLAVYHRVPA